MFPQKSKNTKNNFKIKTNVYTILLVKQMTRD